MYAVVNSKGLVARDFRTRSEALHWAKQHENIRVISQDSKEFLEYEKRRG